MFRHGDSRDFDGGDTAEGKSDIPDEWSFWDELNSKSDNTVNLLDLDPDWDRDMKPIKHTDKELDEEMNVLSSQVGTLTW
jgi:hypothetical protein